MTTTPRAGEPDAPLGTARGHAVTLLLLVACCAARWLVDPLLGGNLWMLPAAVTTVLAARWFGAGPAAVAVVVGTVAGELLFARPRSDWTTMLFRDAGSLALTGMVGALVVWTVTQLRTRTIRLDREVAMRRQAETALEASRRRFEEFLDAAPLCAYLKDADGRFLFMNRHLRQTYPEVVAGRTVHDSFTSDQAEDFTRNDEWVRRTGEPVHCEEVARGGDGVVRHWSTFKFPVVDGQGRRGVGGVSVEVTDRKRADEQATRSESLLRRLIEVQEREKRALCHEFHDGLMQYAIGARMVLEAWRHEHPDADADAVDEAIRAIDAGIIDGRRTIRGIRPEALDDLGLKAAVEEHVASLAGPGLDVEVTVAADVDGAPPAVQTAAFRIVQEACANARRHSGTDRLRVDVRLDGDAVALRVEDFGRGFDTASPPRPGFGVVGMEERARLAGGTCRVESEPGRGTVVTARLAAMPP
ncbi:MAG: PAS domain-containing protein [Planctomycetaceae bacterium]